MPSKHVSSKYDSKCFKCGGFVPGHREHLILMNLNHWKDEKLSFHYTCFPIFLENSKRMTEMMK